MIRVRIDKAAIVAGALIVGIYTMIAGHLAARANGEAIWTSDHMIVTALSTAVIYGMTFFVGIYFLRSRGIRSRAGFVVLGVLSALPAFGIGVGSSFFSIAIEQGNLALALLRPSIAGAIAGFLYRRRAGFETDDDSPEALAQSAVSQPVSSSESSTADSGPALLATATTEYYNGPLQVRASFMAALIAALVGSSVHTLTSMTGLILDPLPAGAYPPSFHSPGGAAVLGIIGIGIPYLIFVLIARSGLARARKTSMAAFIFTGLLTPLVFGAMFTVLGMGPLGFMFTVQFIIPSAAAMAAYRSLAGLEPWALPDDIEVSDRRTLVSEDHVRRKVARIIDMSK
ncbi:MAG: hypothetical protein AB7G25_19595 [Sphingomonadaceae bacterium]